MRNLYGSSDEQESVRRKKMKEFELKYGCNPNQKPAKIDMADGSDLPITILNGRPGYINFLDALNSWQLVRELKQATGMVAATSFKHVSPTSAAVGKVLPENLKKACFVDDIPELDESPLACAYARARGTDRMSSFGDWVALSDTCDLTTAKLIAREVSDGVIAPGYTDEALEVLKKKKKGGYNVVQIDPDYVPAHDETKQVFGISFHQGRNDFKIDESLLENIVTAKKNLPDSAKVDLIVSLITLKYTQSNSVCFAYDGQAIGVGAGQQSRIHCTRLAGTKADTWFLRQHPKTLALPFKEGMGRANRDNVVDGYINGNEEDVCAEGIWQNYFTSRPEPLTAEEKRAYLDGITGVSLGSDAFFPFSDNIKRACASGVSYIAEPGGSVRDDLVIEECDNRGVVMAFTGMRLFHH
ncbi:MAG: phosphoribosylaminoimidazolecarboxamide formyltransferase [Firmicutes bacterium]|nr:phosphoribosylaminoimidazolecarboxamide formyltransferase [Bacillota bacterium]